MKCDELCVVGGMRGERERGEAGLGLEELALSSVRSGMFQMTPHAVRASGDPLSCSRALVPPLPHIWRR